MAPVPNVIIFGETGSGKSSLINMIAGGHRADISSGSTGCTFNSQSHAVDILGSPFNLYDTAGLDEGEAGKVPKQLAIVKLYQLIKSLDTGVNLLIFCMRAPRIRESAPKNWRLFHEIMCKKQVPIVIAITGLEDEEVMDSWWHRNMGAFQAYGMFPAGVACVTATKGKQKKSGTYSLQEEYDESQAKTRKLIKDTHLVAPWRMQKIDWFSHIVNVTYETHWCRKTTEHREVKKVVGPGIQQLVDRCDMSPEEARILGEKLTNA